MNELYAFRCGSCSCVFLGEPNTFLGLEMCSDCYVSHLDNAFVGGNEDERDESCDYDCDESGSWEEPEDIEDGRQAAIENGVRAMEDQ